MCDCWLVPLVSHWASIHQKQTSLLNTIVLCVAAFLLLREQGTIKTSHTEGLIVYLRVSGNSWLYQSHVIFETRYSPTFRPDRNESGSQRALPSSFSLSVLSHNNRSVIEILSPGDIFDH